MRPLGGILLGLYADRIGRKAALQLIIGLMTIAIAMITFAPPFAVIGVAAPLIILIARLFQGLATGGEWGCSTAFLIETAPGDQRGFYGSWQMGGQGLALLAGALISFLATRSFTPEAFENWGWRVPFFVGLTIGPIGLYIRRYLDETQAFLELCAGKQENQFARTIVIHFKELVVCIGLYSGGTISFYIDAKLTNWWLRQINPKTRNGIACEPVEAQPTAASGSNVESSDVGEVRHYDKGQCGAMLACG
jgi:MFS family permease